MSKSIPDQLVELEQIISVLKSNDDYDKLKPYLELRAKLQGDFKDESGGENLIINLDMDPSRICFLNEKIARLESELVSVKTELGEYKKIYGAKNV